MQAQQSVRWGRFSGIQAARFRKQFVVEPGGFSEGGDSGSLIVLDGGPDDRKSVGLLFGQHSYDRESN